MSATKKTAAAKPAEPVVPQLFYDNSKGTVVDGIEAFQDLMQRVNNLDNGSSLGGDETPETVAYIARVVDRFMVAALEGDGNASCSEEFRRGFFLGMAKLLMLNADSEDTGINWDPLHDTYFFGDTFARAAQEGGAA